MICLVPVGAETETRPDWWTDDLDTEEAVMATVTDEVVNAALSTKVETNVVGESGEVEDQYGSGVETVIGIILNVMTVGVVIGGIAGVLLFSIRWATSGGDVAKKTKAQHLLLGTVVGGGMLGDDASDFRMGDTRVKSRSGIYARGAKDGSF